MKRTRISNSARNAGDVSSSFQRQAGSRVFCGIFSIWLDPDTGYTFRHPSRDRPLIIILDRKRQKEKPQTAVRHSNPKPFPRARDGTRTRDPHLGKVVFHQLNHSRKIIGFSMNGTILHPIIRDVKFFCRPYIFMLCRPEVRPKIPAAAVFRLPRHYDGIPVKLRSEARLN